jgi:hypothetical protein
MTFCSMCTISSNMLRCCAILFPMLPLLLLAWSRRSLWLLRFLHRERVHTCHVWVCHVSHGHGQGAKYGWGQGIGLRLVTFYSILVIGKSCVHMWLALYTHTHTHTHIYINTRTHAHAHAHALVYSNFSPSLSPSPLGKLCVHAWNDQCVRRYCIFKPPTLPLSLSLSLSLSVCLHNTQTTHTFDSFSLLGRFCLLFSWFSFLCKTQYKHHRGQTSANIASKQGPKQDSCVSSIHE